METIGFENEISFSEQVQIRKSHIAIFKAKISLFVFSKAHVAEQRISAHFCSVGPSGLRKLASVILIWQVSPAQTLQLSFG